MNSSWLSWNFFDSSSVIVSRFYSIQNAGCVSEFGCYFMFSDVTSFTVNLSQRRDASFFLCGEVCRFIHKLCFRCYTPDTAPLENAWFVLLALKTSEGKYMSVDEFLIRQKLTLKVNTASKQKSEGIHSVPMLPRLLSRKQLRQ